MSTSSFINSIMDKAIVIADRKTTEASSYAQQAIDAANLYIDFGKGDIDYVPTLKLDAVSAGDLVVPTGLDDISGLDGLIDQFRNALQNQYAQFFVDFFPKDTDVLQLALDRLHGMLTDGGLVLPRELEDQVWQRDRDRILADADRNENELMYQYASRGFPLPSGPMLMAQFMVRDRAQIEIAASSRDKAIQAIQLAMENCKFAIQQVIDFRIRAIQSASDYIKTITLAPQLAAEVLNTQINARAKAAEVIATYYGAKVNAADSYNRVRFNSASGDTRAGIATARADAALGAATAAGNQGAAALTQLNAIAHIEGTEAA
jgi:hypothetical protein